MTIVKIKAPAAKVKVKLTAAIHHLGQPVKPGTVIDVSKEAAKWLQDRGKAEPA